MLGGKQGRAVAEIRSLKKNVPSPPDGDGWILIEKQGDLYFVRGRSRDASVEASLAATGVDSAKVAIRGAEAWADLLMASVIYVRDDQ
jgi:hypothetical protein